MCGERERDLNHHFACEKECKNMLHLAKALGLGYTQGAALELRGVPTNSY
jgi:hypothetical protein